MLLKVLQRLQDHLSHVELASQISSLLMGPVVNSATLAVCVVAHKQMSEIGFGFAASGWKVCVKIHRYQTRRGAIPKTCLP